MFRWKKKNGIIEEHPKSKRKILQFIAIKRADSGEWALPGVSVVNYYDDFPIILSRQC